MYFDPGTGSMIIQMVIASIAGIGAFFLTFKTNFIGFIKGLFLTIRRISRCNCFSKGGYDPIPLKKEEKDGKRN